MDPSLAGEIMHGHENYHLTIDENLERIRQLLLLAYFLKKNEESDLELGVKAKSRKRDSLHCYWVFLIDLANFFGCHFAFLGVDKLSIIKNYYSEFKPRLDIKTLSQDNITLSITNFFNQDIPFIYFKKLVQNNPIFTKCSLFLNLESKKDYKMVKVIMETLKFCKVHHKKVEKRFKFTNTQQTKVSLDCLDLYSERELDKDEVVVLGFVDNLQNVFYKRPSKTKKLIMFYLKVIYNS